MSLSPAPHPRTAAPSNHVFIATVGLPAGLPPPPSCALTPPPGTISEDPPTQTAAAPCSRQLRRNRRTALQ